MEKIGSVAMIRIAEENHAKKKKAGPTGNYV